MYHVTSRCCGGQRFFGVGAKGSREAEYFVGLMRKLEAFTGVRVLTYALMGNHFHLLVEEPCGEGPGEAELLERVEGLHGVVRRRMLQEQVERWRGAGAQEAAQEALGRYLRRTGSVSVFVKELKGRFAQWYNRRHGRFGVFWAERFKAVLVEPGEALRVVAAYIDLNPVRAGMVEDPGLFRYSGYGEATGASGAKGARAQAGICAGLGAPGAKAWGEAGAAYRLMLYSAIETKNARPVLAPVLGDDGKARVGVDRAALERVRRAGGKLSTAEALNYRVRYFSDSVALGSKEFVERVFEANRQKFPAARASGARKVRAGGALEGFHGLRDLQVRVMG